MATRISVKGVSHPCLVPQAFDASVFSRQEEFHNRGQLFGKTSGFSYGRELVINVLGVTLLAHSNGAHNHDAALRINSIDHAMVCKPMLPITCE